MGPCESNSSSNREQKPKITIVIHTPKNEETESFLTPNWRLKMGYKVNELYINFVYSGNKQATKEIKQVLSESVVE